MNIVLTGRYLFNVGFVIPVRIKKAEPGRGASRSGTNGNTRISPVLNAPVIIMKIIYQLIMLLIIMIKLLVIQRRFQKFKRRFNNILF